MPFRRGASIAISLGLVALGAIFSLSTFSQEAESAGRVFIPLVINGTERESLPTPDVAVAVFTPTPTPMTGPRPAKSLLSSCTVREERILPEIGTADRIVERQYNVNGLLLNSRRDFLPPRPDGIIDRASEYRYRQDRQRTRIEIFEGRPLKATYVVNDEYDRDDRLVRRHFDDGADGSVERIDRYDYDENGHLSFYDYAGTTTTFTRDATGRVLSELVVGIRFRREINVWEDGLIIRIDTDESDDGTIESSIEFEYDENRRLTNAFSSTVGEGRYEYDARGRLLSEELWQGGRFEYSNRYEYDDKGRLQSHEFSDHAGASELTRYSNDCDAP